MLDFIGACTSRLCGSSRCPERLPPGAGNNKFGDGATATGVDDDGCCTVIDHRILTDRLPNDKTLASFAFQVRDQLQPPRHSGCRVVCLIIYREGCLLCMEVGTNCEVASLAGSCSAVRCALAKLLLRHAGRTPLAGIEKLVIVTDEPCCVLPGYSCCELLAEHVDRSVQIVCCWCVDGGEAPKGVLSRAETVEALYPYPNAYRHIARHEVAAFAEALAKRCAHVQAGPEATRRLFEVTWEAARLVPVEGRAHPVCYAAGVLFRSGEIRACPSALLSGSAVVDSIDPVARLSACLEEHVRRGDFPQTLVITDQWGVLHAPAAVGRRFLEVHGFSSVSLLVHDSDTGELRVLRCGELSCGVGGGAEAKGAKLEATPTPTL